MTSVLSYLWPTQTLTSEPGVINNPIFDQISKFNINSLRKVETKESANSNMNEFMRQRDIILKNGSSISINHDKELAELSQHAHLYLLSYLQSYELMRQVNPEEQEREEMLNALFNVIDKSKEILKNEYKLVKVYDGHTMSKRENYTSLARQFQYVMTSQGKDVFTE